MLASNREREMNRQITITSKTGKLVVVTNTGNSVDAAIPSMGVQLGCVDLVAGGIKARFPQKIGGRLVCAEVQMEPEDLREVSQMFLEVADVVDQGLRDGIAYQSRHDHIDSVR